MSIVIGAKGESTPMRQVSSAMEAYLRTVYNLIEDGVPVRRARLRDRLGQAGPTVTKAVLRLVRDDLISVGDDQLITLTSDGFEIAESVTRRHRLAERMLVDLLDVPIVRAHDEALRWEHVLSDDAERGIAARLLGDLDSPWGLPIPGLDPRRENTDIVLPGQRLDELGTPPHDCRVTIRSISEDAQGDSVMIDALIAAGIIPGAPARVRSAAGCYIVHGLDKLEIPTKYVHAIRVVVQT